MPDPEPSVTTEPTTAPTTSDPVGGGFGGQQPAPTEPDPTVPGGDTTDSGQDPTGNTPGDTWTTVYAIFQAKCGGGFCHGANQLPPQLVGEEAMVLGAAEARAGDIAAVSGVRMPPASSGMTLTPEEEMAIQDWAMSL